MHKRKLIEVALPLEAINRESAREKSIRHGHPSTLHLWWSRKPLATARAVLFAQLVDDPSSHPDRFPTQDDQRVERDRLHKIIERLIIWENIHDDKLYAQAQAEIMASCDGNPPPILDPFVGGGTIALEAQRLGLKVHPSDLNPVAVLITKALVEIPPSFRDQSPVYPGIASGELREWRGAAGLATDVRAYGQILREEAKKRIGQLYPKAELSDGSPATAIAWIWARTVTCPNPACGITMPLVASWWLSRKKGSEAYVVPTIVSEPRQPGGKRVDFSVGKDPNLSPRTDGTVGRSGATCLACHSAVELAYIRTQGKLGKIGAELMAIAAEGHRRREYLKPDVLHRAAAEVASPVDLTDAALPEQALGFRVQAYGMTRWTDLYTDRQLVALTTFCDLVGEVRERVRQDALTHGLSASGNLETGGRGADAYADAVATYLGLAACNIADDMSTLVTWRSSHGTGATRSTFARQALPMTWGFAEVNPFAGSSGDFDTTIPGICSVLERIPCSLPAVAVQANATSAVETRGVLSTDPPYYDNIGYSDLSDYFYVWQRRALRSVFQSLLGTMLVPKNEELVANPYRFGGKDGAYAVFERGFKRVFANARASSIADFPSTVYYAFKQSDSGVEASSSGWETLLDGMIRSGWSITATWPMRSERSGRMLSVGTNALASSIVLALRPRPQDAPIIDRRGLINALLAELPSSLRNLQQGQIAPVDLPQAAIGPGMAVFSRYAKVIEADGSEMTVRSALARINDILDEVLAEQEGDFDAVSRFAIAWYRQHGYGTGVFGTADDLARARNTSVELMDRHGILKSRAGKVTLIRPAELPTDYDPADDTYSSNWECLHHLVRLLATDGIQTAGRFLAGASDRPDGAIDADLVKELAFLLFSIAEKNGWAKDALAFNALAQSWPDLVAASRQSERSTTSQEAFDYDNGEDE